MGSFCDYKFRVKGNKKECELIIEAFKEISFDNYCNIEKIKNGYDVRGCLKNDLHYWVLARENSNNLYLLTQKHNVTIEIFSWNDEDSFFEYHLIRSGYTLCHKINTYIYFNDIEELEDFLDGDNEYRLEDFKFNEEDETYSIGTMDIVFTI